MSAASNAADIAMLVGLMRSMRANAYNEDRFALTERCVELGKELADIEAREDEDLWVSCDYLATIDRLADSVLDGTAVTARDAVKYSPVGYQIVKP